VAGQALVEYGRLLDVLGLEGELLAESAHAAATDAPVLTCPGTTLGQTVRHVGSVYRLVISWLAEGARPAGWRRDPLPGQADGEFQLESLRILLAHLAAHPPEEYASSWWPEDSTYGFWRRRMAHETVIHRVDVQEAAGTAPTAIPEDIAVDGVDEVLMLWFGQRLSTLGLSGTKAGTVAVRTGGRAWIARAGPGETSAWRCSASEAAEADATVSGDPMTVYLWLWGRAQLTTVGFGGEYDLAAQLWALLRLATR
jgi:uncharacterized protein (TIGR03083 family)